MLASDAYADIVREAHELGYVIPTTLAQYNEPMDSPDCPLYILPATSRDAWGQTELFEISNYRELENVPELGVDGVNGIYHIDYKGADVAIAITEELTPEAKSACNALMDYPILNEMDYSDLEFETHCENWENYGRDDLRAELSRRGYETDTIDDETIDRAWDVVSSDHNIAGELEYCASVWCGMSDKETVEAMAKELGLN